MIREGKKGTRGTNALKAITFTIIASFVLTACGEKAPVIPPSPTPITSPVPTPESMPIASLIPISTFANTTAAEISLETSALTPSPSPSASPEAEPTELPKNTPVATLTPLPPTTIEPTTAIPTIAETSKTTEQQVLPNLEKSSIKSIRNLAELQKEMGNQFVSNELMVFAKMPENSSKVQTMVKILTEYKELGIIPLVIMEPSNIEIKTLVNGGYDSIYRDYLTALKNNGISAKDLGIWTILPEPNIPAWGINGDTGIGPEDFVKIINRLGKIHKEIFPDSTFSIMLNSETFEPDDKDWRTGKTKSLLPYLKGIKPGIIDTFGYQGFPWVGEAGSGDSGNTNPNSYLNPDFAMEAAESLGIKKIWFNTGTFAQKYKDAKKIIMSPEQREIILNQVLQILEKVKSRGFDVILNLFAENKVDIDGDWSYNRSLEDKNVLKKFILRLKNTMIKISFFIPS